MEVENYKAGLLYPMKQMMFVKLHVSEVVGIHFYFYFGQILGFVQLNHLMPVILIPNLPIFVEIVPSYG